MNISEFGKARYNSGELLDFSAALNPLGIPASARKAVMASRLKCAGYPDPECTILRRKLSVYENIPTNNIVCGNGGDDLIFRVVRAVKPRRTVIFSPCSKEYKRALEQNGCEISEIKLSPMNNFTVTSDVAEHITDDTDMVFLCSPNNPTGLVITPYTLSIIANKCRRTNTLMVCDERYIELVPRGEKYSVKQFFNKNIVIIKSFTKIFSMSGLPVGYALCGDEMLAAKIKSIGRVYGVSGAALAAAEAAVEEYKFVKMSRKYVAIERNHLSEELTRLGLPVFPSQTSFLLFASELPLDRLLYRKGILIKDCSDSFGLDYGYFRTGVRIKEDNDKLISTLEKVLQTN